MNAALADWPPRGSLKPRPDFHLNPGTPKVSYLGTVWISVNLPLTSSDRIKPARTCMDEWACLCFCSHQREALHVKLEKKKKKNLDLQNPHDRRFRDKLFYLSDKQRSWPRVRASCWHGQAHCQILKKQKGNLTLFLRFYPWVNHIHHRSKSTCLRFWL